MIFNNMRTFGVELEVVVPMNVARAHRDLYAAMARAIEAAGVPCRGRDGAYDHRDETVQWKIVSDASVGGTGYRGAEVVSPILSGAEGFEQIKTVDMRTSRSPRGPGLNDETTRQHRRDLQGSSTSN